MTAPAALAVDQVPQLGQLATIAGATWRIEHVDQRASAYGVVARWVDGHRPVGAEADGADLWLTVTVVRPRAA